MAEPPTPTEESERGTAAEAPPPPAAPPPAPLYSRGGIVGMVFVLILEIPLIWVVANWMRHTDLEAVPTVASGQEAALDLGAFKAVVQTLRGAKTFSAQIKLRVNPELKDPAIGHSLLRKDRLKVKQEIQAAIEEAGEEAVEVGPAANARLAARIRDRINGTFVLEEGGPGILSEVYLVEQ